MVAVSVSVITFNQSPYIEQTIRAILGQVADFPVNVLVSDDCSDDDTALILRHLVDEFPGRITLNVNSQRLGMGVNFLSNLARCTDEFVAICDGDDLWTDPNKLQKQITCLMAEPRYAIACHPARLVNWQGEVLEIIPRPQTITTQDLTAEDLVRRESFFATSSIVYRREVLFPLPAWFHELDDQIDYPLNFHCASRGDILLLPEPMSLYRSGSSPAAYSSQPGSLILDREIEMYSTIRRHAALKFDADFARLIQDKVMRRAIWSLVENDARSQGVGMNSPLIRESISQIGRLSDRFLLRATFALRKLLPRRIRRYILGRLTSRLDKGGISYAG